MLPCLLIILAVHAHTFDVIVTVDWDTPVAPPVQVLPSLQVVSQHFLWRDSPIHDASFAALAALEPQHARLATWFPYPHQGVAELMPPSGPLLCGPAFAEGGQLYPFELSCGTDTITDVQFASFGRPKGLCGNYQVRGEM
jgi:hypothetical protein